MFRALASEQFPMMRAGVQTIMNAVTNALQAAVNKAAGIALL